jgi:hypothetical protein
MKSVDGIGFQRFIVFSGTVQVDCFPNGNYKKYYPSSRNSLQKEPNFFSLLNAFLRK